MNKRSTAVALFCASGAALAVLSGARGSSTGPTAGTAAPPSLLVLAPAFTDDALGTVGAVARTPAGVKGG